MVYQLKLVLIEGERGNGQKAVLLIGDGIDVLNVTVLVVVVVIVVVEEKSLLLVGVGVGGRVVKVVVELRPSWTHKKSPGKIWHCGKTREGFQDVNCSCEIPKLVQIS
jgi:hypothetical protein